MPPYHFSYGNEFAMMQLAAPALLFQKLLELCTRYQFCR